MTQTGPEHLRGASEGRGGRGRRGLCGGEQRGGEEGGTIRRLRDGKKGRGGEGRKGKGGGDIVLIFFFVTPFQAHPGVRGKVLGTRV